MSASCSIELCTAIPLATKLWPPRTVASKTSSTPSGSTATTRPRSTSLTASTSRSRRRQQLGRALEVRSAPPSTSSSAHVAAHAAAIPPRQHRSAAPSFHARSPDAGWTARSRRSRPMADARSSWASSDRPARGRRSLEGTGAGRRHRSMRSSHAPVDRGARTPAEIPNRKSSRDDVVDELSRRAPTSTDPAVGHRPCRPWYRPSTAQRSGGTARSAAWARGDRRQPASRRRDASSRAGSRACVRGRAVVRTTQHGAHPDPSSHGRSTVRGGHVPGTATRSPVRRPPVRATRRT